MLFPRLKEMNIGKKLTFFITLCSCGTFLIMCLLFFSLGKQYANKNVTETGTQQVVEGQNIASNACSYLRGIAEYYCSNPDIQSLVQFKRSGAATESPSLYKLFQYPEYVLGIVLYNVEGEPLQYVSIDASQYPLPQGGRASFELLKNERAVYCWEYIDSRGSTLFGRDNSPKICLWRAVKGSNNSSVVGVMAITMDLRRLLRFNMPYNAVYYKSYVILDGQTSRVVSNYTPMALSSEDARELTRRRGEESFTFKSDGGEYGVFSRQILDTPLWVSCFVSKNLATIYERGMLVTMSMAVVAFLILLVLMLIYVYKRLTKPLGMLTACMNSFAAGNFAAKISFQTDDDIGRLGKAFNQMVEDNHALIETTYVAQLKAKEAELQLLQTQINPHFIYNLINSIQWTALRHKEPEIADTAYSMGQMLRICLNRGNAIITVDKECELVNYYLKLQKNRFRDRLSYAIDIDEAARGALIPKLIIQPLVENSVVHGAESIADATHIDLTVTDGNGRCKITVTDDGAGIPPEILAKLPRDYRPEGDKGNGYALRNIYERLELLYGHDFAFTIESQPMAGTRVKLEFPMTREKGGEKEG